MSRARRKIIRVLINPLYPLIPDSDAKADVARGPRRAQEETFEYREGSIFPYAVWPTLCFAHSSLNVP